MEGAPVIWKEEKADLIPFRIFSYLFTETCAESQTSTSCEMVYRLDSKGFMQFRANPVFALACGLLKQAPLCAQDSSEGDP